MNINGNTTSTHRIHRTLLLILFFTHAGMIGYGAYVNSPTLNEPSHLVAGLSHLEFWRFELYRVNPPLVRTVAAIPVWFVGYEQDWSGFYEGPGARAVVSIGEKFTENNESDVLWLVTLARWACIPFSWIGLFVCYAWTRDIVKSVIGRSTEKSNFREKALVVGRWAGLWSAGLWCFSPNILAHAQLMTPDAHATALGLAACYAFWNWLQSPSWMQAIATGLILGVAELAKSTLILFYPIWPLIWCAYRWPDRHAMFGRDWIREGGMLAVRMLVGIYVLNLGYGFEGTGTRLGELKFVSNLFSGNQEFNRFKDTAFHSAPIPFPKNYLLGIDIQQKDFEEYPYQSYVHGTFRDKGWWYYYAYVVLVKVPMGMWCLAVLAAAMSVRAWCAKANRISLRDQIVILSVPIVIFCVASLKSGFSQHGRYVLPCFPFLYVWTATSICTTMIASRSLLRRCLFIFVTVATAWAWASSISTYPHCLSYFNELGGGPTGGPKHLLHSNIDWGQDLRNLSKWIEEHPEARPMHVAYYGAVDPIAAGIKGVLPVVPSGPTGKGGGTAYPPGWYAISVNYVFGVRYPIRNVGGASAICAVVDPEFWQSREPNAASGYSIYLYHLP